MHDSYDNLSHYKNYDVSSHFEIYMHGKYDSLSHWDKYGVNIHAWQICKTNTIPILMHQMRISTT
jgi:hypothetical protein